MGTLRLSTTCADLAQVLDAASSEVRARAGLAAAQWAIQQTSLANPKMVATHIDGPTDHIVSLVEILDEKYFDLQDQKDEGQSTEEEVLIAFAKARAANSLLFAVRREAEEAIYEASFCASDVTGLRRAVLDAIKQGIAP